MRVWFAPAIKMFIPSFEAFSNPNKLMVGAMAPFYATAVDPISKIETNARQNLFAAATGDDSSRKNLLGS